MMNKILILANFDVGLYKFRKELIQELIENGNTVYISIPYGEFVEPLRQMGCIFLETSVDRRGINPITDSKLMLQYYTMIKQVKPDMVITYTIKPNVYGGLVCRFKKVPYAVNITGLGTAFQKENIIKKLVCFLYKFSCKKAKVVFFENEGNRQVFLKENLVREEQTCLLNGAGVNTHEYAFTEYPDETEPIHFLFIGRVMKEKGVDELFVAAKKMKERYSDVAFDVVGPFEEDYKEQIHELVKAGIIVYHGFQSDVKTFIKNSHCFVLPSYHEGMANTLLECGAMGRPLITSRIHGCMEAVREGVNGFLVETQDVEKLCEMMTKFIELDYDKKKEMGKKSREWMEEKFDKRKVVEKTIGELLNE